ncbi:MAG TPA: TonB-dependent siderophore receptor, partial [Rhizomicrobium sp.]|nr:TonB-dependent siderophore receptor [Rhizomicrobium sp.]
MRLLAGASLTALLTAGGPGAEAADQDIEEILVTGAYAAPNSALPKLPEPLLDTPISVTTVTGQLMSDRGDTNLNDALRNAPGVTLASNESSFMGNVPYIRGFSARTDMFLDGMRDIGMYYRDPFNMAQVEVLEGPDSILFGRGSTGGVVEQDSKTPQLEQFATASASGGTNALLRATGDMNIPLDGLGTPAALRINVMGNTNKVADRDIAQYNRFGVAPSLALGLGTPTRLTVSYFYQGDADTPDFGVPWYFGKPAPVPRRNYYDFRSDRERTNANIGTVKLEHDAYDWLTLNAVSRYAAYGRFESTAKPGLAASVTPSTPLASAGVALNHFTLRSVETQFQNQVNALAKFATGDIRHDLVAGAEYDFETSDPRYYTDNGLTNTLLNPDENQAFKPTLTFQRADINTTTNTEGAYLADTMKLDRWQLTLGARIDRFSVHFLDKAFGAPPAVVNVVTAVNVKNREDTLPSWHAALIYKPVENGTFYLTYGTSFNPSAETLDIINSFTSFSLNNENIGPERNQTIELGTKWAIGGVVANASLFETDKVNVRIPDPSIPGFNTLGGNQRVQGFELNLQGKIMEGWNVNLGYDYLSSGTTRTAPGGPVAGFPLVFTPHNNLKFWTTYQVLPELEIGGGGEYVGSRYAQTSVPVELVPDYMTFDAMAKYKINDQMEVQLNAYNLTDRLYYDMAHFAFVVPGAGRSAMLT